MTHKCIYMYIYEEFTIRSRIQAYNGDANIYRPLWTQHVYVPCGHIFSLLSIFFLSYSFPKDIIIPHIIDNHMTNFLHHCNIMYV